MRALLAASPLLLLLDAVRQPAEAGMAVHMAVLALVAVAGYAAGPRLPVRGLRRLRLVIDAHGLLTLTLASCVLAFWMLPVALDLSLLRAPVGLAKYVSLWASGLLIATALRRVRPEALGFFAGNLSLMLGTGGLLYMEAPARLCLSYRFDEQKWTGVLMVLMALLLGLLVAVRLVRSTAIAIR